jgi:Domain of unknown function (DUF4170)
VRNSTPHHDNKAQRLHLVFGGELTSLDGHEFSDLNRLDIVGVYPDYDSAFSAWKSAAQKTVDNAMMRYVIVHLHKLLEPDEDVRIAAHAGSGHANIGAAQKT